MSFKTNSHTRLTRGPPEFPTFIETKTKLTKSVFVVANTGAWLVYCYLMGLDGLRNIAGACIDSGFQSISSTLVANIFYQFHGHFAIYF